jgi:hypothetical protein
MKCEFIFSCSVSAPKARHIAFRPYRKDGCISLLLHSNVHSEFNFPLAGSSTKFPLDLEKSVRGIS